MTRNEIIELFKSANNLPFQPEIKKYKEGFIFDEDKSVKWNREEVQRRNKMYEDEYQKLKESRKKAYQEAEEKLFEFLSEEYSYSKLNSEQLRKIYNYSYEEHHSDGYLEVLLYMDELVDFILDVNALK